MGFLLLLLTFPPLLLSSDHGVIILGGEGEDGPVDTVSLLTEEGWCPPENVILPPLPMAASELTAHHGQSPWNEPEERPYLMVCGFPEGAACYQISPLNGHIVWTPVKAEDPGIDMSMLEYVHSYSNMIKGGVSSMWINKTSGEYQFLWSPMVRNGEDVGFEQMAGWYFDQVPNLSPNFYDLGMYARLSCIAGFTINNQGGYPSMLSISGGYNGSDSLSDLLLMSNIGDGDWEWHFNSMDIGQPRSDHSCIRFSYLGMRGLLLAGGYSYCSTCGGAAPSTLDSLVFMFPENDNHDDLSNANTGIANMVEARSGFGLENWGEEGLVALGGREYGIFPGQSASYKLKDTVEIFDTNEDTWSLRDEWKMEAPRAGFGIITGYNSNNEVHGSEYCKNKI